MKINSELKGFLYIMLADLLWGLSATVAKYLFNKNFSVFDLFQIRVTLSFVILVIYLMATKPALLKVEKKDIPYIIILGIFGLTAVQFFYYYTISETNVATAVFLEYLAPTFILVYGLFFQKEQLSAMKLITVAGAALGGLMIVKGTTGSGISITVTGLITGLCSAITFAFYSIYGKYGLSKYSPWTLLVWGMGSGTVFWLIIKYPWVTLSSRSTSDWLFFIYIAVFATIIPYGFYLIGLKYLHPLSAGIVSNMEPVIASIISYMILGEKLTSLQSVGCALIISSIIFLQYVTRRSYLQLTPGYKKYNICLQILKRITFRR
ncbi:MAG: EamA family transporter [Peptococcaceae bacterium]|nr:EamA family transporter [Peptococcaceae bacterium]